MGNGFTGPPAVDFYSQLSGLGDVLQKNRQQSDLSAAFQPGPDGKVDYAKALTTVAQYNPALAASMQNHLDEQAHQKITDARQAAQDALNAQHWNASFGLQKRAADRADDPTPTGFQKQANGTYAPLQGGPQDPAYMESVAAAKARAASQLPPDGFARQPDGTLAPVSGGPTDPAYLANKERAVESAKGDVPKIMGFGSSIVIPNKASEGPLFTNKMAGGGLTPEALDIKATQWNNGDYEGATKNVGRGNQGSATLEAIANRAAEKLVTEGGMSPENAAAQTSRNMQAFKASSLGQGAEARTAGVREANLNLILRAADAAIPAALEASDKVSRTGFVPLNKVIQKGQVMTSDPDLKRFGMANLQLAEHWARAMNPTGVMRESDRDKALQFLGTADTKATYRDAVEQLRTQILRERDAVKGSPATPPSPSFGVVNDPSQGNLTGPGPGNYVWTPQTGVVPK